MGLSKNHHLRFYPKLGMGIERLPPYQYYRILGVWISPYGYSDKQTKQLREITTAWADRFRSRQIKKADAWFYFQSKVKEPLKYPLVATTMSKSQCQSVESSGICSDIQESGLLRNPQIDIVEYPLSVLRINNRTLYGTQGKRHIHALMYHVFSNNTTGNHFRDLIEAHKLEIGCSGNLF